MDFWKEHVKKRGGTPSQHLVWSHGGGDTLGGELEGLASRKTSAGRGAPSGGGGCGGWGGWEMACGHAS